MKTFSKNLMNFTYKVKTYKTNKMPQFAFMVKLLTMIQKKERLKFNFDFLLIAQPY